MYFQLDPDAPAREGRNLAARVRKSVTAKPGFTSIEGTRGVPVLAPGSASHVPVVLKSDGRLSFSSATLVVVADDRTQTLAGG
jgi:hypothetical protein